MSNTLYDYARKLFATAGINWPTSTIKCFLVSASYTPNFTYTPGSPDTGWHTIASLSGATVGPTAGVALTSLTADYGAVNAANVTFASVSGATVTAIVLALSTGTDSTSPLIAYIDTATGLPITPNGGDIIVSWDTGPNKIFKL